MSHPHCLWGPTYDCVYVRQKVIPIARLLTNRFNRRIADPMTQNRSLQVWSAGCIARDAGRKTIRRCFLIRYFAFATLSCAVFPQAAAAQSYPEPLPPASPVAILVDTSAIPDEPV